MSVASRVYEACDALFANYPLATRAADEQGDADTIVLLVRDELAAFFILLRDHADGETVYLFCPWDDGEIVSIEADTPGYPDLVIKAITSGIPIPRDGSIFGWVDDGAIASLIVVRARYTPASPEPSWSVMPLAESLPEQWPPFTQEHWFGEWFWSYYRTGRVISLGGLIATMPDTFFWVDTFERIGSDCCVVTRNLETPGGSVLYPGRYVDFRTILAGRSIPLSEDLLANSGKSDLAPRFQEYSRAEREGSC